MAYADYNCKCGKTLSIHGKGIADAEQKAKWAEGRIFCEECRLADAAAQSEQHNLPALTGSAKQIAWASEIRELAITSLPSAAQNITISDLLSTDAQEQMRTALHKIAQRLLATESAGWWIENRHNTWKGTLQNELNAHAAEMAPLALEEIRAIKAQHKN